MIRHTDRTSPNGNGSIDQPSDSGSKHDRKAPKRSFNNSSQSSEQTAPRRTRSHDLHSMLNLNNNSWLAVSRWILLGIMIGSSATAIFQSISMPAFCIGGSSAGIPDPEAASALHPMTKTTTTTASTTAAKKKTTTTTKTTTGSSGKKGDTANKSSSTKKDSSKPKPKKKVLVEPEIQNFTDLSPPPVLDPKNDTFAACLLIKDDNHWLIEWLAYHYQVMPLRKLVLVIDPDSKTSPKRILARYNKRKLMSVKIWKDKDFMPTKITATVAQFDNNTALMMHRVRQNNFYRRCISHFRDAGQEWLMLVDTDEYVLPSYASGHFRNLTTQVPFQEPGSVLRLLKYYEQSTNDLHTCVYMPRFFFGAQESRDALVKHNVPDGIDAHGMVTQRFLYREPRRNYNGKNLIHLKRVPSLHTFGGVHHVSTVACPDPDQMRALNLNKHALIRVHHYLGTLEQYMFRDDPRLHDGSASGRNGTKRVGSYNPRGVGRFNNFNKKANHEDHAAKAWIRGFINAMGEDLASELLAGVGKVGYEPSE
ncbi:expressed unknown protein [Seminavis robusta]|uniref:Glycosyltransferase family 92 protein n=1 Tax=Seminavis robusta TaxID=568900 RepID=A0A9N8HAE3_9STRA|nr:expressed unknown protein [Seminavis robusta]|eukprot:Sro221_g090870.1 n/a (535) ;mRNA; r:10025-11803